MDPGIKNCCVILWENNELKSILRINFLDTLKYRKNSSLTWLRKKIETWGKNNAELCTSMKCETIYIEQPIFLKWINIANIISNLFANKKEWIPLTYRKDCIPNWKCTNNYKQRKRAAINYVHSLTNLQNYYDTYCIYDNTLNKNKKDDICDAIIIGKYVIENF